MEPTFFETPADWRAWLEQNHASETVLVVGFYKQAAGKQGMTYIQAVNQALCFGWIDGVAGKVDDERYTIRFARRKPSSTWSQVNLKRIEELTAAGLMHPYGLDVFNGRDLTKQNLYASEQERVELPTEYESQFRANQPAWEFFQAQSPSYRKNSTWWVISAKQEATRLKRLATLIEDSAAGRKLKQLTPKSKQEG